METYNNKLAVHTRTLLYGAGLPAKYWSAVLLHAANLNNYLVHSVTQRTPFEGFYGHKLDITYLKMIGSPVCVKHTGVRRSKLDHQDFTGIFLGYAASDQNKRTLDLESGIVKETHHATFDEAWCMQPSRPPATKLFYDLGIEANDSQVLETGPAHTMAIARYPPLPPVLVDKQKWGIPTRCLNKPLPLRGAVQPQQWAAAAE